MENNHEHNISISAEFTINTELKRIEKPEKFPYLVQGSHNSERFGFAMQKVVGGHDMSESKVKIHYTLSCEGGEEYSDVYEVDDLITSDDKISFSWPISDYATKEWGELTFSVEFECGDDYRWKTIDFGGIAVFPSQSNIQKIASSHPDVIKRIFEKLKMLGNVRSDWEENDESKEGYIRHRPFYTDNEGKVIPIPDKYIPKSVASAEKVEGIDKKVGEMSSTLKETKQKINVFYDKNGKLKEFEEELIPDSIKYAHYITKLGECEINNNREADIHNENSTMKKGDILLIKATLNGVTEEYEAVVPELGNTVYADSISAIVGKLNFVGDSTIWFTEGQVGTQIEVYKMNKVLISEGVTELYGVVNEIDAALDRIIEKYGLGDDSGDDGLGDDSGDNSGDDGFVMPEGAFAMAANTPLEKGKYQFVCFEKEDGSIITEIPEHYSITGGIGTDIETDVSSAGFVYGYPYLDVSYNMQIFGGFDSLYGDYTVDFESIPGTTYIVKVG